MALTATPAATVPMARMVPVPPATTFRACELCAHAVTHEGRLMCGLAGPRQPGGPQSLDLARSRDGPCGPSARHLDMAAWHRT